MQQKHMNCYSTIILTFFLKTLKKPPKIIFTTAYDKFAAVAFDLNAVDYIVKPVSEDRFVQALGKLNNAWHNKPIDEPADDASQADHVFFKTDGKLIKVLLENILYLEALKDFTRIFLKDNKSILVGVHLKAIENLLPAEKFMRVHRSYSVFLKSITAITGNTLEIDRIQIPIGPSFKEDLYRELKIL
jgi:two-component system, LytTR family, response regulator